MRSSEIISVHVLLVIRRALLSSIVLTLVASLPVWAQNVATATLVQQAWQALQAGDGERAESLFQQALRSRPNDDMLNFGAGVAAHLLGHEDEAERSLKRALQLNPQLAEGEKVLGDIENGKGKLDEAVGGFGQLLA